MVLPQSIRSKITLTPSLNREYDPPKLVPGRGRSTIDVSYPQFSFDDTADKLGRGESAVVHRATIPERECTVALKRPYPDRTVATETAERLLDEAENWEKVDDHPYIVNVLDWGFDAVPWIAMEYMSGGPLTERGGDFGPGQRLWTVYAITDAVAYANNNHLSHHDITPNNILFQKTPEGTWDIPKVADWGLSRNIIQQMGSISQVTQGYAAPEHFDSLQPEAPVDAQTDVYQLGVVGYEVLTGEHPSHLEDDVPAPSDINPAVPGEIDSVIRRALAHDRTERFDHPVLLRKGFEDVLMSYFDQNERRSQIQTVSSEGQSNLDQPESGGSVEETAFSTDRDTVTESEQTSQKDCPDLKISVSTTLADRITTARSYDSREAAMLSEAISRSSGSVSLAERIRTNRAE